MTALPIFQLCQIEIVLNNHTVKSYRTYFCLDVRAYLKTDLKKVIDFIVILIVFVYVDQLLSILPESKRLNLFYSGY